MVRAISILCMSISLAACGGGESKLAVDSKGRPVSAAAFKAAEAEMAARKRAETPIARQAEHITRNAEFRRLAGKDRPLDQMEKAVIRKAASSGPDEHKMRLDSVMSQMKTSVLLSKRNGNALGRARMKEERRRRPK